MSYTSGINQRFRNQELYSNYTAEDVPITNTSNLGLIANLKYVQEWMSSVLVDYMTVLNPIFSGSLTSSTGGNIAVSSLTVGTITSNTNFTGKPTINTTPIDVNVVGEIMLSVSNTPPPNFILCDGRSLSSLQYQKLYSLIGTTYGGSGGVFNLPNFSSYFPIGANNISGTLPSSNFATGNGQSGANNTYSTTSNSAGGLNPYTSLLTVVPSHSHNIDDPSHAHAFIDLGYGPIYIPVGEVSIPLSTLRINPLVLGVITESAKTGIVVLLDGSSIQSGLDPVSGLYGVNMTPPYTTVFYFICYNSN
jgi:microcystin-dependent protein